MKTTLLQPTPDSNEAYRPDDTLVGSVKAERWELVLDGASDMLAAAFAAVKRVNEVNIGSTSAGRLFERKPHAVAAKLDQASNTDSEDLYTVAALVYEDMEPKNPAYKPEVAAVEAPIASLGKVDPNSTKPISVEEALQAVNDAHTFDAPELRLPE